LYALVDYREGLQVSTAWHYLRHGAVMRLDWTAEELGRVEEWLIWYAGQLRDQHATLKAKPDDRTVFPATPNGRCAWCSYRDDCPALLEEVPYGIPNDFKELVAERERALALAKAWETHSKLLSEAMRDALKLGTREAAGKLWYIDTTNRREVMSEAWLSMAEDFDFDPTPALTVTLGKAEAILAGFEGDRRRDALNKLREECTLTTYPRIASRKA
jgi:hypothetical protein